MESSPSSSSIKLDPDVRDVLDYTLQILLAQICQRYDQGKGNEMEVEGARSSRKYGDVGLLLDIALWMGQEEMIEHSAPLELVRDFFQSHTIEECQQFFGLLEERAEQFSRAISVGGRAPNTLLRSLSEVRKRLSRTNDLVFAGRILMFMAYAFPLSDKSGVNLKGETNVGNITTMDKEPSPTLQEATDDKSEPPVDWNFYQMFWGLQAYFLDPVKAFDAWEQVTAQLNAVLNVFKQYPISEEEANAAKYSFTSASTDCYLTKYLTSSRLLRLQLRDPWFRRHIMVQFLIFFQSLRFVSESPAIPHHKLKEQQKNEIAILTKKTKTSLWETPPNGMHFTNTIYAILKRENNWTVWKEERCPPFEKPPVPPLEKEAMRASREVRVKKKKGLAAILESESVTSRDLQSFLRRGERGHTPSLEEWLKPVVEQMSPEAAIENQYKLINTDKVYVWRAKRLIFRQSLEHFGTIAKPGSTLEDVAKNQSKPAEVASMVLEEKTEDKREVDANDEKAETDDKSQKQSLPDLKREEGQPHSCPDEISKGRQERKPELSFPLIIEDREREVGEKRKGEAPAATAVRDDAVQTRVSKRRRVEHGTQPSSKS